MFRSQSDFFNTQTSQQRAPAKLGFIPIRSISYKMKNFDENQNEYGMNERKIQYNTHKVSGSKFQSSQQKFLQTQKIDFTQQQHCDYNEKFAKTLPAPHFQQYINKKVTHKADVLSDQQINSSYKLVLPVVPNTLENNNNFIHFQQGFEHAFPFIKVKNNLIKQNIENTQKYFQQFKDEKQNLKQEIQHNQIYQMKEINNIEKECKLKFEQLRQAIRMDYNQQFNENIQVQKEITKFKRYLQQYAKDVQPQLNRIEKLEIGLFNLQMYDLQQNHDYQEESDEDKIFIENYQNN